MQYQLISNSTCIRVTDDNGVEYCIPSDPANTDYQAYQQWLAADPENNIPLPADE